MKKLFLILVGVALAGSIFAAAGLVYAAAQDPPEANPTDEAGDEFSPGFFGRRGRPGGSWGWGEGLLGDYMIPALAEAFDLSDDQISAFQKVRETIQAIRDQFTTDEIHTKMQESLTEAAGNALADEVITQDQYSAMLERMEKMGEGQFGSMGGRGMRGGFGVDEIPARDGGIIQEYLDSAMAEALDISLEDLQTMKEEGLNLNDYAVEKGLTVEELQNLIKSVHLNAIQAAFDDNAITEEQYQLLMERVESSEGRLPFGPGGKGPRRPGW
jgi:hypothetical protein